jgi:uncharacterized protein (DUF849 family)
MKRKVILTCAAVGNAPFNTQHPSFPVTPKEICASVIDAAKAGASIAHIHVRDPQTKLGSTDPALFREVVARIRDSGTDIVVNLTCGSGGLFLPDPSDEGRALPESDIQSPEQRVVHVIENLPEIATLDVTTGNQIEGDLEFVYLNTQRTLRAMARHFLRLGVKPELEAFNAGDVLFANQLLAEGLLQAPPMYQFVLGVKWGAPATPETMIYMRSLLPADAIWAAFGLGRLQMPMVAQAVLLGGNVRVGLEDNLYLDRGVFATNAQLVERAATIISNLGETVATPSETREMLKLPKRQMIPPRGLPARRSGA